MVTGYTCMVGTYSLKKKLKSPCDQKINSYFSLDFKTMLTKR